MCVFCVHAQHYIMRSKKWIRRYLRRPSCAHTFQSTEKYWAICYRLAVEWNHKFPVEPKTQTHIQVFPSRQWSALSLFHFVIIIHYSIISSSFEPQPINCQRPHLVQRFLHGIFSLSIIFWLIFHSQIFL